MSIFRILCVGVFALAQNVIARPQTSASKPISEATFKTGKPFAINVPLPEALISPYPLMAQVAYRNISTTSRTVSKFGQQQQISDSFSCFANISSGDIQVVLKCSPADNLKGGEYRPSGPLHVWVGMAPAPEPREIDVPDLRLPIVTLIETPPPPPPVHPPAVFPKFGNALLVLGESQVFDDGSFRAQRLLEDMSRRFPNGMRNSKQNRAFLLTQVHAAQTIIQIAEARYIESNKNASVEPPSTSLDLPILFDDFTQRLDSVAKDLGGNSSALIQPSFSLAPRLYQVQLPKTTESVDAQLPNKPLDANLSVFLAIVADMAAVFERISETGSKRFLWSITTIPTGAEVYYSRLNHPEQKWSGFSNFKEQSMEYAGWTFRVSWQGCSKSETPDPYLQPRIEMSFVKAGCSLK